MTLLFKAEDDVPIRVHDLKCAPGPFDAVWRGAKAFEWRKNDRDYRVGDALALREWDSQLNEFQDGRPPDGPRGYSGRWIVAHVTHVSRGPAFEIPEGFCVMSIVVVSCGLTERSLDAQKTKLNVGVPAKEIT